MILDHRENLTLDQESLRYYFSLFYRPLQLLFKTKINSQTRQVNSANHLIYECHKRQRLNFNAFYTDVQFINSWLASLSVTGLSILRTAVIT